MSMSKPWLSFRTKIIVLEQKDVLALFRIFLTNDPRAVVAGWANVAEQLGKRETAKELLSLLAETQQMK